MDRVVPSVKLMKGVRILQMMGNGVEIEEEVSLGGVVLVEVIFRIWIVDKMGNPLSQGAGLVSKDTLDTGV